MHNRDFCKSSIGRLLYGLLGCLVALGTIVGSSFLPSLAQTNVRQATITTILKGNQIYIQQRQARKGDVANFQEIIHTLNAIASLRFNNGAVSRMRENSILQVGVDCNSLYRGRVLNSGQINSCVNSRIVGVRGTTYTVEVDEINLSQVKVFEGEVTLADLDGVVQTVLTTGQKATLLPTGAITQPEPLTLEDYNDLLKGPLVQDFSEEPLPTIDRLQQTYEQKFPGQPFPLKTATQPPPDQPTTQPPVSDSLCQQTIELYKQNLQLQVDRGWKAVPPPSQGVWTLRVQYEVSRTGMIQNVRLVESSGYAPLDESAVSHLSSLQGQFSPLPSCYRAETMNIVHRFQLNYF